MYAYLDFCNLRRIRSNSFEFCFFKFGNMNLKHQIQSNSTFFLILFLNSNFNKFQQISTNFNKFQRISTNFNKLQQILTNFDKFQQIIVSFIFGKNYQI